MASARTACFLAGSLAVVGCLRHGASPAGGSGAAAPSPASEGDGELVVGPTYDKQPELTDRGAPRGRRFEFTLESSASHIFRGEDVTLKPEHQHPFTRRVFVYVPAAYHDGVTAPFLIIHDGPGPFERVSYALDNLTISTDPQRRLPPFIAIAVANGGSDSKGSERGLEYDTLSDRLARFINDEVLPAITSNAEIKAAYPHLAFTTDPWGRGVLGCSSGGAAAMTMGWFRPDLFRRIITYSGTFVDQQDDDAPEEGKYPLGAWEYHSGSKLVENSPTKPLRIFLHVSENDLRSGDPEESHHNWVMANRRMSAALRATGYPTRFVFARGARHCDRRVFDQTLADTLVWMWRDYRTP